MREGFWKSDAEPDLLMPVAQDESWKGQGAFLTLLLGVELFTKSTAFRGMSICRICKTWNGNATFELDGWEWPSGLAHYIKEHNVKPSNDFIEFIRARC